jgi:hypothetical protein
MAHAQQQLAAMELDRKQHLLQLHQQHLAAAAQDEQLAQAQQQHQQQQQQQQQLAAGAPPPQLSHAHPPQPQQLEQQQQAPPPQPPEQDGPWDQWFRTLQLYVSNILDISMPRDVERSAIYSAAVEVLREAAEVEQEGTAAAADEARLLATWRALCQASPARMAVSPSYDDSVEGFSHDYEERALIHSTMRPGSAQPTPPEELDVHASGPEYGA